MNIIGLEAIVPVASGEHITVPTADGTGYVGQTAPVQGLYFKLPNDGGGFFVPTDELKRALEALSLTPTTVESDTPSPYTLWKQANGDRQEYEELLVRHGFLNPMPVRTLAALASKRRGRK